jgi:hypothetical protein
MSITYDDLDPQVKPGSVNTVPNKPDSDKKASGRAARMDKPNSEAPVTSSGDDKPRKRR